MYKFVEEISDMDDNTLEAFTVYMDECMPYNTCKCMGDYYKNDFIYSDEDEDRECSQCGCIAQSPDYYEGILRNFEACNN